MAFRFETLDIWHMAIAYASRVYSATAKFPRHEDYGLRSQMNRAVNSISLNIAEGSAKSSNKAFDYHLEVSVVLPLKLLEHLFWLCKESILPRKNKRYCIATVNDWQRPSMHSEILCYSY
jgi:hypothetical protein